MSEDNDLTGRYGMGTVEITDDRDKVWVPLRQFGLTRFAGRDVPINHTQRFPSYADLKAENDRLRVASAKPNGCPVFGADGRSCGYGAAHSIQVHMLTDPSREPGPDNPAIYVNDDQLDEYGCYEAVSP